MSWINQDDINRKKQELGLTNYDSLTQKQKYDLWYKKARYEYGDQIEKVLLELATKLIQDGKYHIVWKQYYLDQNDNEVQHDGSLDYLPSALWLRCELVTDDRSNSAIQSSSRYSSHEEKTSWPTKFFSEDLWFSDLEEDFVSNSQPNWAGHSKGSFEPHTPDGFVTQLKSKFLEALARGSLGRIFKTNKGWFMETSDGEKFLGF